MKSWHSEKKTIYYLESAKTKEYIHTHTHTIIKTSKKMKKLSGWTTEITRKIESWFCLLCWLFASAWKFVICTNLWILVRNIVRKHLLHNFPFVTSVLFYFYFFKENNMRATELLVHLHELYGNHYDYSSGFMCNILSTFFCCLLCFLSFDTAGFFTLMLCIQFEI